MLRLKEPTIYKVAQWYKLETKRFVPSMVSGSSHVVANMMVTGGLHGR